MEEYEGTFGCRTCTSKKSVLKSTPNTMRGYVWSSSFCSCSINNLIFKWEQFGLYYNVFTDLSLKISIKVS